MIICFAASVDKEYMLNTIYVYARGKRLAHTAVVVSDYLLGKFCFDNLRFRRGYTGASLLDALPLAPAAAAPDYLLLLSLTIIILLVSAFLAQIGKCLYEASSENMREQWGHCLRLSKAFYS